MIFYLITLLPSYALLLHGVILFVVILKQCYQTTRKPPIAPGANPLLGHTKVLLKDLKKLAIILGHTTHPEKLLRLKFPFRELWITRDTDQILNVLSDPKTFDFGPMKSMVLKNMLGLSNKAVEVTIQDNSGVGYKPLPNSNVPSDRRFNYQERNATHDFSKPLPHAAFVEHFEKNIYQWVDNCGVNAEWVEYPDLYTFVRDMIFRTTTDAFFGPHLLQQSPHLAEDIWKFDQNIPFLASGCPTFLNPAAARVRTRCTEAFRKWRSFALKEKPSSEWNETSGLKCMSLRKEVFDKFVEWDDNSCAASDFAVLFGLSSNITSSSFWLLLETIKSRELYDDAIKEVAETIIVPKSPPRFDQKKLLTSPLLQSLYAETLRMYTSVLMLRKTRQESKLGDWTIPRNQDFAVCNYSAHMDEKLWSPAGESADFHPVSTFWGRRFLRYDTANTGSTIGNKKPTSARFCQEGLSRKWFPFGYGERTCPGRNFAKHQMLLTFAVLTTTFDIELQGAEKSKPDMKHFGYGVMPPESKTPFKIRRL